MTAKEKKTKFRKLLRKVVAALIAIALMASSLGCDKNTRTRRNESRRVRVERAD